MTKPWERYTSTSEARQLRNDDTKASMRDATEARDSMPWSKYARAGQETDVRASRAPKSVDPDTSIVTAVQMSGDALERSIGLGGAAIAERLGYDEAAEFFKRYADKQQNDIESYNYQRPVGGVREEFNSGNYLNAAKSALYAGAENAASVIPGIAAGSIAAASPVVAAPVLAGAATFSSVANLGDIVQTKREYGLEDVSDQDFAAAASLGVIDAVTGKLGSSLVPVAKTFLENVKKHGLRYAIEAGGESVQEIATLANAQSQGAKVTRDDYLDSAVEAAAAGAVVKGGFDAARSTKNAIPDRRDKFDDNPEIAEAQALLAKRLADQGFDLSDVQERSLKGANAAVDNVHKELQQEANFLARDLKALSRGSDAELSLKILNDMIRNKVKNTAANKHIDAVRKHFGDTKEGLRLIQIAHMSNQLKTMSKEGARGGISKYTSKADIFDGNGWQDVRSSLLVSTILANVGFLGGGPQGLVLGALAGTGANLVAKAIDKATNRRSRVKRFIDSYRDGPGVEVFVPSKDSKRRSGIQINIKNNDNSRIIQNHADNKLATSITINNAKSAAQWRAEVAEAKSRERRAIRLAEAKEEAKRILRTEVKQDKNFNPVSALGQLQDNYAISPREAAASLRRLEKSGKISYEDRIRFLANSIDTKSSLKIQNLIAADMGREHVRFARREYIGQPASSNVNHEMSKTRTRSKKEIDARGVADDFAANQDPAIKGKLKRLAATIDSEDMSRNERFEILFDEVKGFPPLLQAAVIDAFRGLALSGRDDSAEDSSSIASRIRRSLKNSLDSAEFVSDDGVTEGDQLSWAMDSSSVDFNLPKSLDDVDKLPAEKLPAILRDDEVARLLNPFLAAGKRPRPSSYDGESMNGFEREVEGSGGGGSSAENIIGSITKTVMGLEAAMEVVGNNLSDAPKITSDAVARIKAVAPDTSDDVISAFLDTEISGPITQEGIVKRLKEIRGIEDGDAGASVGNVDDSGRRRNPRKIKVRNDDDTPGYIIEVEDLLNQLEGAGYIRRRSFDFSMGGETVKLSDGSNAKVVVIDDIADPVLARFFDLFRAYSVIKSFGEGDQPEGFNESTGFKVLSRSAIDGLDPIEVTDRLHELRPVLRLLNDLTSQPSRVNDRLVSTVWRALQSKSSRLKRDLFFGGSSDESLGGIPEFSQALFQNKVFPTFYQIWSSGPDGLPRPGNGVVDSHGGDMSRALIRAGSMENLGDSGLAALMHHFANVIAGTDAPGDAKRAVLRDGKLIEDLVALANDPIPKKASSAKRLGYLYRIGEGPAQVLAVALEIKSMIDQVRQERPDLAPDSRSNAAIWNDPKVHAYWAENYNTDMLVNYEVPDIGHQIAALLMGRNRLLSATSLAGTGGDGVLESVYDAPSFNVASRYAEFSPLLETDEGRKSIRKLFKGAIASDIHGGTINEKARLIADELGRLVESGAVKTKRNIKDFSIELSEEITRQHAADFPEVREFLDFSSQLTEVMKRRHAEWLKASPEDRVNMPRGDRVSIPLPDGVILDFDFDGDPGPDDMGYFETAKAYISRGTGRADEVIYPIARRLDVFSGKGLAAFILRAYGAWAIREANKRIRAAGIEHYIPAYGFHGFMPKDFENGRRIVMEVMLGLADPQRSAFEDILKANSVTPEERARIDIPENGSIGGHA